MYVTYICILYPSILVSRFTLSNIYPYILFFFANSRLFLLCPNIYFPASGPQRINNVWKFGAYRYIHKYNTRVLQPFPRWFAAFLETTSKPVMVRPGRGLRYLSSAPALLSFFFYWSGHASSAPTCPMATYIVLSSTQCQGDTRIVLVQIVELDRRVWPKSQEGGQSHQEMFTLPNPTVELGLIRHLLRVFQHHPLTTSRILRAILYHHTYMHMYP